MNTIYVKPAPSLSPAAAKVLKSDTGVGLLDAACNVPEAGMPWPNGGLTFSLLRDGAILLADDPVFAVAAAPAAAAAATGTAAPVPTTAASASTSAAPAASPAPVASTAAAPAATASPAASAQ